MVSYYVTSCRVRHLLLLYLVTTLSVLLGACSSPKRDAAANAAACNALSKVLSDQEQIFINQAQVIRAQHVFMLDYDREMISAINDRRNAILATKLTELSVTDDVDRESRWSSKVVIRGSSKVRGRRATRSIPHAGK